MININIKLEDPNPMIDLCIKLLSEEFQAWYQYFTAKDFLEGNQRKEIEETFEDYAEDELNDHGNKLLKRISQLGGSTDKLKYPDWDKTSGVRFIPIIGLSIIESIWIVYCNEFNAIKSYNEAIETAIKLKDHASNKMFKEILSDENEHQTEMFNYLRDEKCIVEFCTETNAPLRLKTPDGITYFNPYIKIEMDKFASESSNEWLLPVVIQESDKIEPQPENEEHTSNEGSQLVPIEEVTAESIDPKEFENTEVVEIPLYTTDIEEVEYTLVEDSVEELKEELKEDIKLSPDLDSIFESIDYSGFIDEKDVEEITKSRKSNEDSGDYTGMFITSLAFLLLMFNPLIGIGLLALRVNHEKQVDKITKGVLGIAVKLKPKMTQKLKMPSESKIKDLVNKYVESYSLIYTEYTPDLVDKALFYQSYATTDPNYYAKGLALGEVAKKLKKKVS